MDRLRSRARRLPRRVRLRHSAPAQGPQAGREAARRRLPARAGRRAEGRHRSEDRAATCLHTPSPRRLAERGFITFAPQNPYIGEDTFRTLQRKANPLEANRSSRSSSRSTSRSSTGWRRCRSSIPQRIAFYGLSYGGKTAMRVPAAAATDYCLSICSADFNEWVGKNASVDSPYSYMFTGEYEIFEFDLGNTFNYAEMAALIAPRPFMVERGHYDGVGTDEMGRLRVRQGPPPLRQARHRRPTANRVLRRPAHDQRRRHVRVPAQASELAQATISGPTLKGGADLTS